MSKAILDADEILQHADPVVHQKAHEIQPFGHLVRMPIALAESVCKDSVDNLNQVLADTMTLRDMYKKHHWQVSGPTFYQLHLCSTSTSRSRPNWSTASPSGSRCSAASASPWLRTSPRRPSSRARQGREEVPVQISRLLHAHEMILKEARAVADAPPSATIRAPTICWSAT